MRTKRYPKGTWMKLASPEILRAHIAHKGYSLERVARYAGCSRSMVSHLTSGRKRSCSSQLAHRLAEALDVPVEALFLPQVPSDRGSNGQHVRSAA